MEKRGAGTVRKAANKCKQPKTAENSRKRGQITENGRKQPKNGRKSGFFLDLPDGFLYNENRSAYLWRVSFRIARIQCEKRMSEPTEVRVWTAAVVEVETGFLSMAVRDAAAAVSILCGEPDTGRTQGKLLSIDENHCLSLNDTATGTTRTGW